MSSPIKKIYTIEILPVNPTKGVWYANKAGRQYEAELVCKSWDSVRERGIVVFEVNPCQFVYQIDCKIISEQLVEKYVKL